MRVHRCEFKKMDVVWLGLLFVLGLVLPNLLALFSAMLLLALIGGPIIALLVFGDLIFVMIFSWFTGKVLDPIETNAPEPENQRSPICQTVSKFVAVSTGAVTTVLLNFSEYSHALRGN